MDTPINTPAYTLRPRNPQASGWPETLDRIEERFAHSNLDGASETIDRIIWPREEGYYGDDV